MVNNPKKLRFFAGLTLAMSDVRSSRADFLLYILQLSTPTHSTRFMIRNPYRFHLLFLRPTDENVRYTVPVVSLLPSSLIIKANIIEPNRVN